MKPTVLITGGHISPAIALIQELKRRNDYSLHIAGRRYAFSEAKEKSSYEYEAISAMAIPFYDIESPRLPSGLSMRSAVFPFIFIRALFRAFAIFKKNRPSIVVSFGGYVSAPIVVAAWLKQIPVIMHEQTLIPGRANKVLSRLAAIMCIAWESSRAHFPTRVQTRCILTGLPVRDEIRSIADHKKDSPKPRMTLYITGGSSGAHRINELVMHALPVLLKKYHIIHQCGDSHYRDFEKLTEIKSSLSKDEQKQYEVYKYIDARKIASVLQSADIMVGRSGANTTVEIVLMAKPAVLIPLPESAFHEQQEQAALLEKEGIAIVCNQQGLTPERLVTAINSIAANLKHHQVAAHTYAHTEEISLHYMAHARLADIVDDGVRGSRNMVS